MLQQLSKVQPGTAFGFTAPRYTGPYPGSYVKLANGKIQKLTWSANEQGLLVPDKPYRPLRPDELMLKTTVRISEYPVRIV